jgi:Thiamine pyrophosphate enzyme, C-terminal TPP binding domain
MLGTGIPSAVGAKLGNPAREVVCISGDGAAGFNFMEMQSAARENLKLVTIVFAEGSCNDQPQSRPVLPTVTIWSVPWSRNALGSHPGTRLSAARTRPISAIQNTAEA